MPKKIQECTKAHLFSVPLPVHGASYTVISHQFVVDYSYQALANAGFGIVEEEYRCTADGQIAQGIYKLQYNNDPELSMMFAWTNSYNKQVKFKCLIGAYINKTGTVMTSGDIGTWTRKHMGTADTETKATIDDQIANAHMYYNQLVADKDMMVGVILNKRKQAQLLGVLFAEFQILTTEQASIIRSQMDRPSHVYENNDSLWAFYNYVTIALQQSHPRTWMEDQRILHYFIGTICNFSAPVQTLSAPVPVVSAPVDPLTTNYGEPEDQTNLLVQIAEVTGDESVLEPSLPVEPADYDFTQTVDYSKAVYPKTEDEAFQNIKEVTEQALKDELVFGISGIAVSAEGIRNVPIEEVLEKMQEEHPIPEVIEDEEAFVNDEVVTYTDPAGNTFEAPVVVDDFITDEEEDAIMDHVLVPIPPCAAHDSETEKDLEEEIKETEVSNFLKEVEPESEFAEEDNFSLDEGIVSLAPTPEEILMIEAEEAAEYQDKPTEEVDLGTLPVKEDDFDLDLDFNDMDSQGSDEIPDFF